MKNLLLAATVLLIALPAVAVEPSEVLDDPVLETRARKISKGLRCLVCQNQSIDDSAAVLARDLRVLVRERLVAGDGDQEVIDYVVSRYGDFVLLKPPFKAATIVLWAGPAVLLLLGLIAILAFFRRNRSGAVEAATVTPLTEDEKRRLAALLENES